MWKRSSQLKRHVSADDSELLARIARRWYIDGQTQLDIAREFNLSRPKVQRLLERARASGIVEIRIGDPSSGRLSLETELAETFALDSVIVSPSSPDPAARRAEVARSAATYLERRLGDELVITVGHGRDVGAVPLFFHPAAPIFCVFVSAMGGSPRTDAPTNPNEICRALADRCDGRAESLYAPVYVESADIRDGLLAQDPVSRSLRMAAGADIALVGIGDTNDDCTMVRSGCLSVGEIAELRRLGAAGDVLGNYVDIDGRVIPAPHDSRLIGLSIDDLRRIDSVVAVASGEEKPRAVLGALRAGIVDVLIVDEANARAVIGLTQAGGD